MFQQALLDWWSQFGRQALESYRDLGEIQVRVFNRLFQQQLELVNVTVESGLRQLHLIYEPAHYRDVVEKQTELAGEINEQLATVARRTNDVLVEANNKFSAWADRGVRAVTEQVQRTQQVAGASAKKAAAA